MIEHVFDLAAHEQTRLAAVLDATGYSYDPDVILANERAAAALLYSGLDANQQCVHDELVAAGVLA